MAGRRRKRKMIWIPIVVAIVVVIAAGLLIFKNVFKITDIEIEGSDKYTYDELFDYIFKDRNSDNTILFKYTDSKAEPVEIPFISKVDIKIAWPDTIKIKVYEKNIIGYVKYKGTNMYFDKDGTVVECATENIEGIPQVTGLKYQQIVLNSKLQVENEDVFSDVCDLVQYLNKYQIAIDTINVNGRELSVVYNDVEVLFGENDELLPDKVYEFGCMKDGLKDLSGTLYLDSFTGNGQNVIFKEKNK